jgi:exopolyphosphatase / guanosine-5'-triphosphate,3'-diphosphate pyrophosphatase
MLTSGSRCVDAATVVERRGLLQRSCRSRADAPEEYDRHGGMRVAAIDLGTNSTRLLVADVEHGRLRDVDRDTTITRLGEGVDGRRRLLPVPITRVRNVLVDYRRRLEALEAERTLAIATSAVRDAENGEAFLGEVEWGYGFSTALLSGDDEALMMFRGVTAERDLSDGTVIVDIGGGSTELVVGGPSGVSWHTSIDIGSVRLTERALHSDPPSVAELDACAVAARTLLGERVPEGVRNGVTSAIGVAGTITSLAALAIGMPEYDRDRVHGYRLTAPALDEQLARLASVPLAARRALRPLDPDRAPVIVGGAVIARETLAFFELDALEISERDILDGAALAAAELPAPNEEAAPPGAYTCC